MNQFLVIHHQTERRQSQRYHDIHHFVCIADSFGTDMLSKLALWNMSVDLSIVVLLGVIDSFSAAKQFPWFGRPDICSFAHRVECTNSLNDLLHLVTIRPFSSTASKPRVNPARLQSSAMAD
jgi:hypothetical protein